VNAIPDVIVRTDLAGEILFVNDNTLKIGGYSLEEMQGQNLLKFISPENHEDVMKDLLLMRKSKLGPKEYNLIMKDGTEIPFEVNADFYSMRRESLLPLYMYVGTSVNASV